MALRRVGCDLGNFGVKVDAEDVTPFVFEARFEKYKEGAYMVGGENVFSFNGNKLIPGRGNFDYETRKINRTNLVESLAYGLALACNDKDEAIVGVCLPVEQYHRDKEEMKRILTAGLGDKITVELGDPQRGNVVKKTIYIESITVMPESLAAFWAYEDELISRGISQIIMADIGGRTTDTCTIEKRFDGSIVPCNPRTMNIGTLSIFEEYAFALTEMSRARGIDCEFKVEDIEALMQGQISLDSRFLFIQEDNTLDSLYREAAMDISRFIKRSNPSYGKALIVVTGGGAARFGTYVTSQFRENSELIADIYCNARGCRKALEDIA